MSSYKKANRQITETTLQNLPEEVYEALGEHGYKGKIKSDKLTYAGIIYERETISCLTILFFNYTKHGHEPGIEAHDRLCFGASGHSNSNTAHFERFQG